MKQACMAGVCALAIAGAIGCGRGADEAATTRIGCLTTSGQNFVLTDLERGAATTEAFRLVGRDDQLRPLVGQQVRITGDAEPAKVAVVRESTPPAQPEAAGTSGGAAPQVNTETETRVEFRELEVASVEPTGETCVAEVKQ